MAKQRGHCRIIGGQWRGRKVAFAEHPECRPTPDRVRETLFNWLRSELPGAACVDLFAGSGVLGLEALSHGAGPVVFVDQNQAVVQKLTYQLTALAVAPGVAQVLQGDCQRVLMPAIGTARVVFCDPPYHSALLDTCCTWLLDQSWVGSDTWVYAESDQADFGERWCAAGWQCLKQRRAGRVHFGLFVLNTGADRAGLAL